MRVYFWSRLIEVVYDSLSLFMSVTGKADCNRKKRSQFLNAKIMRVRYGDAFKCMQPRRCMSYETTCHGPASGNEACVTFCLRGLMHCVLVDGSHPLHGLSLRLMLLNGSSPLAAKWLRRFPDRHHDGRVCALHPVANGGHLKTQYPYLLPSPPLLQQHSFPVPQLSHHAVHLSVGLEVSICIRR